MYKKILVFLCVCILCGCQNHIDVRESFETSTINVKKTMDMDDCPLVYDSIQFMPLNLAKSKISIPSKIYFHDNKVVVLDKIIRKQLCVFSMDGDFLYDIGKRGHAADEYMQPYDFDIRNDSLFLIDSSKKKVLVYNICGQFLCSYGQEKMVDGILALDDGGFLLSVSEFEENCNYQLIKVNRSMKEEEGILLMDKDRIDDKIADNVFQRVENLIYYHRSFDSEILELNRNGDILRNIKVDFCREHVDKEFKTKEYQELKQALDKHNYEFFIDCPIIADDKLYANCFVGNKKATALIDIQSGVEYNNIFDVEKKIESNKCIMFPKTYFNKSIVGYFDATLLPLLSDKYTIPQKYLPILNNGGIVLCFYKI